MSLKVFRDAVHNMIALHREEREPAVDPVEWGDALLLDLIDSPPVQRLRRIRQLGLATRVYPSGEHSRFSHALGVMHLAKRILELLQRQDPSLFTPLQMLAVKTAALLHDVGHGPFSHVFEHLHPGIGAHETWGWRIVAGDAVVREAVGRHCRRLGLDEKGFWTTLRRVWLGGPEGAGEGGEEAGEVSGDVAASLGHQIISSQLDADRLDYLLRDAHFTGVAYGRYDLEWLLHSLQARWVKGEPRLCVETGKGPAALENYLHARDHMYRQVYDHKTVRGFEALLIHLFMTVERFRRESGALPSGTPPPLARFLDALSVVGEADAGGNSPEDFPLDRSPEAVARYAALDDAVLEYAFAQWLEAATAGEGAEGAEGVEGAEGGWGALLAHKCRLLIQRKPVYRRMTWKGAEGSVSELIPDAETVRSVARWLAEEGERRVEIALTEGGRGAYPLSLLVRMDEVEHAPYHGVQYDAQEGDPIHVVDAGGRVARAEEVSDTIKLMSASKRRTAWLFIDPAAWEAVRGIMRERFTGAA